MFCKCLLNSPSGVCAHLLPICSSYAEQYLPPKQSIDHKYEAGRKVSWPQATKVDMAVDQTSVPNTMRRLNVKQCIHVQEFLLLHHCKSFQQYMYRHIAHSATEIPVSNATKSPRSNAFCVAKESLTITAVQLVQCQHAIRQLEHNMQEGIKGII